MIFCMRLWEIFDLAEAAFMLAVLAFILPIVLFVKTIKFVQK